MSRTRDKIDMNPNAHELMYGPDLDGEVNGFNLKQLSPEVKQSYYCLRSQGKTHLEAVDVVTNNVINGITSMNPKNSSKSQNSASKKRPRRVYDTDDDGVADMQKTKKVNIRNVESMHCALTRDIPEVIRKRIRALKYVPLWYFSTEGRAAAASIADNGVNNLLANSNSSSVGSVKAETSFNRVIEEEELSYDLWRPAILSMIQVMREEDVDEAVIAMNEKFFLWIEMHELSSTVEGRKALRRFSRLKRGYWCNEKGVYRSNLLCFGSSSEYLLQNCVFEINAAANEQRMQRIMQSMNT